MAKTFAIQVTLTTLVGVTAWVIAPSQADACGGCFAPNETVTVVTGHRMAVALSATETTLWDQIEYAGDPEDFAWVLPIQGENLVELADNAFFEALDQVSQIQLQGTFPPLQTNCPDPCGGSFARGASDSAGESPTDPDVMVFGEAVVGPYETATIGSEDPEALVRWLQENGYAVPDAILPVIAHYVDLGLNFAALKLNPNAGVSQMQPVRITTPGLMPVFPLRMVAAGVSGSVALDLFVFAEGRYEAQNFEVVEIDRNRLVYDWATSSFNYNELFDLTLQEAGGRTWIAEYAQPAERYRWQVENFSTFEEDGTTQHFAGPDFEVVTRSIEAPYLTRLRSDLTVEELDQDLVLQASLAGSDIENFIQVDNEINRPDEPECPTMCTDPSVVGGTNSPGSLGFRDGGGDGLCAIGFGRGTAPLGLLGLGIAASVFLIRRRRR